MSSRGLEKSQQDAIGSGFDAAIHTELRPHLYASKSSSILAHPRENVMSPVGLNHIVDPTLKSTLDRLYVGLPHVHKAMFGSVVDLEQVSEAVFNRCMTGKDPDFNEGWCGWPKRVETDETYKWLVCIIPKLEAIANDHSRSGKTPRKLLQQPRTPLGVLLHQRSMTVGFVDSAVTQDANTVNLECVSAQTLIAGQLKSSPAADASPAAWADLARQAREIFIAQRNRQFVLGFTLCGPLMRVWEFDWLGGVASECFDINEKSGGLQFVTTILGFLFMTEEMIGCVPMSNGLS